MNDVCDANAAASSLERFVGEQNQWRRFARVIVRLICLERLGFYVAVPWEGGVRLEGLLDDGRHVDCVEVRDVRHKRDSMHYEHVAWCRAVLHLVVACRPPIATSG